MCIRDRGLAFFPLFFIGVMTIEATFSVMIMLLIAYVVANMVMHKGLKNFGHSLTVLICSMVLAVSCYAFCNLSINHIRDNGIKETSVDSVESIDLYMSPIDMKMNSKIYYKDRIKVNISDKNLIKQMLTSLGDYSREVISVNLDNGKKYTNIFTVSESSYTALYEYIQNDQTLIKKLSSYEDVPVLDSYLMTNGNESVNENDRIPLGKLNGNIMNTIKESRKNMSVAQRYSFNEINNNDVNGGIELENKDSEQYSVISYRYIGGEYYSDRYVLDKDSELANNVLKQVNDKALSEINNFKNKNTVLRIISYPQKYDDNYLQKEVFEDIISNILINYHDEVIENIASNIDNDFSGENLCRIALYKSKYPGYMGSDSGKYYG